MCPHTWVCVSTHVRRTGMCSSTHTNGSACAWLLPMHQSPHPEVGKHPLTSAVLLGAANTHGHPRSWKHAPLQPRNGAPDSPSLPSETPKQLMAKEQPQTSFLPMGTPGPLVHQHRHRAPHAPTNPALHPNRERNVALAPHR